MNEETARLEAKKEWPLIEWGTACPVLPAETSPIDNASWLVMSRSGAYIALVDGGPGSQLYKRQ